jgi:hypothetical protein
MYFSLHFPLLRNKNGMQAELLPTINAWKNLSKSHYFRQSMGRVFKRKAKIQTDEKGINLK